MSVFLGDLRIKAALTLGLEDIAKNDWLLDDILGDSVSNPYLAKLYSNQISSCKQWLANNRINILLSESDDKMQFPSVTIEIMPNHEKAELKTMGDLSTETVRLMPNDINKPIPYIVAPTSGSYDLGSGVFTFSGVVDLTSIAPGQILVDPATGNGYQIQGVLSETQIQLTPDITVAGASFGIIPQHRFYEARVGHTFLQEEFVIGCNASDQQTCLWLHSIVYYLLLRYRQPLLEHDGLAESLLKSSKLYPNPKYSDGGQVTWSRDITLTGQTESRVILQPHRYLENAGFSGPLQIISNITNTFEDPDTVTWITVADDSSDGDMGSDDD